ncbi:SHUGOSHIN 2 isoform X3 [Spinacia oleracea]|uniref:SHUGOSHIN 2 isoform X3 n=1 Tax=Spinacia oleracea TaxID=3562 RepID=A0ABM3RDE3_SPIOL|nr:SHUGOSHIN 2-like isoform X3 [Spinacia oleracea]
MKGDKMIKSSSFGSRMRKSLSDITNLKSQHKSPFKNQENIQPAAADSSTKNCMEKLLQENAVMIKLIEEKNKIIESNGIELQKLRVNLQRTQMQNWELAKSNSQMFAELNMAKDKMKTLRHELLNKDALSKAMALELKEGETELEEASVDPPLKDNDNNNKSKVSKTKRGRPARSQSMGPPTMSQQADDKEMVENKRQCLRRQSARLKPLEKQEDDFFDIEVANNVVNQTTHFSLKSDKSDAEECLLSELSTSEIAEVANNVVNQTTTHFSPLKPKSESSDAEECLSTREIARRSSIGRPQRRATEKVQSYKEPPCNTKIRRPA